MKFTVDEFRAWKNKCVTLLGMSGVGKTHLSGLLRRHDWFHYSGDYRIGTRYLDEPILDLIKARAMRDPFLRELLRRDWITIRNVIKINDLGPVMSFVGKLGNPEHGGLPLDEFNRRQALYRQAEIAAMFDVPDFVRKAQEIYNYPHLVNDVGGSLCELDEPRVIELLARHSLILYIRVPEADEIKLIERAQADPKPLYYRPEFLRAAVKDYLAERGLSYVAEIEPDDFTRWVFPRLFHSRVPRYEAIARPHGYSVSSEDVARVRDEEDFLQLIESAIAAQQASA
ncbi:MAG: ATPase [Chromatiaceae bacterium]|nr:ATPase [Chromatiaceae bacterium]